MKTTHFTWSSLIAFSLTACVVGADDQFSGSNDGDSADSAINDVDYEGEDPDAPDIDESALTALAAPAQGASMRVCNATALNQRTGAGVTFSIVQTIPEGSIVKVISTQGNWVQNNFAGKTGFSSRTYLCDVAPDPQNPPDPQTPPDPQNPPITSSLSESIGRTQAGSLKNSVRIASNASYVITNTGRNAGYGTEETVQNLVAAFDAVRAKHPNAQRPQIRDASVAKGGRPAVWPHASHQSGRDVDITYMRASCSATTGCLPENVSRSTLAVGPTWTLMEYWLTRGMVSHIFVDSSLHAGLKAEAATRGHSAAKINQWFSGTVQHAANHLNHLHVRFVCPDDDTKCVN
jgi:murein endopeptidase